MSRLSRLFSHREFGVAFLIFACAGIVGFFNHAFLSVGNIRDILVQCAPAAIVACGMTLVIVMGEIDISVGSMMGLLAAVLGILTSTQRMGLPVGVGVAITLALGSALGLVNGLLVTYGRVPSIIVTLGMLTVLRGVTEILMGGEWISGMPSGLRFLGSGSVAGIPACLIAAAVVIVAFIILATNTRLGRRIYAVGGNEEAARLAGLPVRRLKILVFVLTGFLTAVAMLVSATQLSVIESGIGGGFELLVVTCVMVGGASTSGGIGTIAGSVLGAILLGMIRTELIFLKLGPASTYWERAIQGAFILLAVLADHVGRRRGDPCDRPGRIQDSPLHRA